MSAGDKGRLPQLDSLRGLAALSVILHHLILAVPDGKQTLLGWVFHKTPLAFVHAGPEAVVLFFVLSGFVLALPFRRGPVGYPSYAIRRICRIYVPYLAATVVAISAALLCNSGRRPELSDWFNGSWQHPVTASNLLGHLLLIIPFDHGRYNNVIWSLIDEMRVSLVFPWLVLLSRRIGALRAVIASGLVWLVIWYLFRRDPGEGFDPRDDILRTIQNISFFLIGIALVEYYERVTDWLTRVSATSRAVLFLLALALYSYSTWRPLLPWAVRLGYIGPWLTALAATAFIMLALVPGLLRTVCLLPPLVWAGRVSYSIYLYHLIVLLSLIHLAPPGTSLLSIGMATLVLTLIAAELSYRFVEAPSMRLGRRLTERLRSAR